MKKNLLLLLIFMSSLLTYGQTSDVDNAMTKIKKEKESKIVIDAGLDLFVTWIWRGQKMHNGPDMQPWINFNFFKNWDVGAIGVVSFPSDNYYEVDLYTSYDFGWIKPVFTSYYVQLSQSTSIFDLDAETSGYLLEGGLVVKPIENWTIEGYTFFAGADEDSLGNNYYSTYIETSYQFKKGFSVLIGATVGEGFYKQGDFTKELDYQPGGFAVVNIGVCKRFNLKNTPIDTYIYVNPQAERIYVTAAVRLFENK